MPFRKPTFGTQLNRSHPFSRGLVGAWLANERTGNTLYDCSGYNHHGTIVGSHSWPDGPYGTSLSLNGTGGASYVQVADSPYLDNTTGLTIMLFDRADSGALASGVSPIPYVSKRIGNTNNQSYDFFVFDNSGAGPISMWIDLDGSNNRWSTNHLPSELVWYSHTLVFDGDLTSAQRGKFYVDGKLVATGSEASASIPNYSSNLYFGLFNSGGTTNFKGQLGPIFIWKRALNAAEVSSIYNNPYQMFGSPNKTYLFLGSSPTQHTTTLTGNLRLSKDSLTGVTGSIRLEKAWGNLFSGNIRLSAFASSVVTGNLRLKKTSSQDIIGGLRLEQINYVTSTGNLRLSKTGDNIFLGRTWLSLTSSSNLSGGVRLSKLTNTAIVGNLRLTKVSSSSLTGSVLLSKSSNQDISGNLRLQSTSRNTFLAKIYLSFQGVSGSRIGFFISISPQGKVKWVEDVVGEFSQLSSPEASMG